MTILATGIGYLPQLRPTQRTCRHCDDPYIPATRSDKYCQREPCQAERRRLERERKRRTGH